MPDEVLPDVTADEILSELHEAGRSGTAAKFARYVAQRDAGAADSTGEPAPIGTKSPEAFELGSTPETDPEANVVDVEPIEDPEVTPPEPGKRKKRGQ